MSVPTALIVNAATAIVIAALEEDGSEASLAAIEQIREVRRAQNALAQDVDFANKPAADG